MSNPSDDARAHVALNRFGLGARLGEKSPENPTGWLIAQLNDFETAPAAVNSLPSSRTIATTYRESGTKRRGLSDAERFEALQALHQRGRDLYRREVAVRTAVALNSQAPFVERLVHFWANHFAISADMPLVTALAGSFEREAIRPHVLGRFEDMLLAAETHPAMLFYLDQARSIGPNSPRAKRAAKRGESKRPGINENLAREILELHTLGVRTGYSQKDVTEFALAMTGWTVIGPNETVEPDACAFKFRRQFHEPGPRTILGRIYGQEGMEQAKAVLHGVARSAATATHVATKLARHFVADEPPPNLIERLKLAFLESEGDLPTLYRTLIAAPEAWGAPSSKFKSPWEWSVSALRAIGYEPEAMAQTIKQLGQPVWQPQSPAGYDDIAASWAAPDALVRRVEVAQQFARKADPALDARDLARALVGNALSPTTATEIARAESPATAIALLLVSPEFQRR